MENRFRVSIVMTYWNRPQQFRRTLETIALSKLKDDLEIVLVDDGSMDKEAGHPILAKSGLRYKSFYIFPEEKTWVNPCVAFNLGFRHAEGEVVIIQNAECFHVGDLVAYAYKKTKDRYLVYSCKKMRQSAFEKMKKYPVGSPEFDRKMEQLRKQGASWHQHPKINPRKYHFTSSISRENLERFGGFDERYAPGYCFDDNEFVVRMERSPIPLIQVPPDEFFSVHQYHPKMSIPALGNKEPLWQRNRNLLKQVTMKETRWSVAGQEITYGDP